MTRLLSRTWVALLLLAACKPEAKQGTEVLLEIDAEPSVRAQLGSLEVDIRAGAAGDKYAAYPRHDAPAIEAPQLPLRVGLVPLGGDATRFYNVTVTAYDARHTFLAQARLISGYLPGTLRFARLVLQDACLRVERCEGSQESPLTCRDGACVDPHVAVEDLSAPTPPATPDAATIDNDAAVARDAAVTRPLDAGEAGVVNDGGALPPPTDANASPDARLPNLDASAVSPIDAAGLPLCKLNAMELPCRLGR
jgi:hypothetical protein